MIRIDSSDARRALQRLGADVERDTEDALNDAAAAALLSARGTTLFKDRTGKLRGTLLIKVGRVTGARARTLWARMPYASYIEDGTRPHEIRARRVQFLRFEQNGRIVFRRRVWHPGTAKRPFMDNAARQGAQALMISIQDRVADSIERQNA